MPHTHECPMRWADMDLLGHVNNVRYLDYLAAGREAMFEGLPAGRAPVMSHQVDFASPLVFHRAPVLVDTWVTRADGGQVALAQEVYDDKEVGARQVYLRASTVLDHALDEREQALAESSRGPDHDWRELTHKRRPSRSEYALEVRRADLDERGVARDGVVFEYLQESRIRYLMDLHTRGEAWTPHVIARTDVHYRAPITIRAAPYTVSSWIGRLGTRSFTVCAEVCDGDTVLVEATVVMVTFDVESQRPAAMTDLQRRRLQAELDGSVSAG